MRVSFNNCLRALLCSFININPPNHVIVMVWMCVYDFFLGCGGGGGEARGFEINRSVASCPGTGVGRWVGRVSVTLARSAGRGSITWRAALQHPSPPPPPYGCHRTCLLSYPFTTLTFLTYVLLYTLTRAFSCLCFGLFSFFYLEDIEGGWFVKPDVCGWRFVWKFVCFFIYIHLFSLSL